MCKTAARVRENQESMKRREGVLKTRTKVENHFHYRRESNKNNPQKAHSAWRALILQLKNLCL